MLITVEGNPIHMGWEEDMILYCRRSIIDDSKMARETKRLYGEIHFPVSTQKGSGEFIIDHILDMHPAVEGENTIDKITVANSEHE
nr:hypothetical protein [Tanacetum cinerariifolium]